MKKPRLSPRLVQIVQQGSKGIALVSIAGLVAAGCTPQQTPQAPTATEVFEPNPNHNFAASSGTVLVNALAGRTVCITTDGTAPAYNNGTCSGGTTQTLSNNAVALDCGSDTDSTVVRSVQLAFAWDDGKVVTRTADYLLDCTPPPPDSDGDGVIDASDNCPDIANADQTDTDGNGIGDACQDDSAPDADYDGRPDTTDNCTYVWNVNQADADNDGIGNVCDDSPQGAAPALWANDELAQAMVQSKDEIQCKIRCSDPTGAGDVGTYTCANGGTVNWTVNLEGLSYAHSYFTYNNCQYTVSINVHDYASDPDFTNPNAKVARNVTLVLNGQFHQKVTLSGDGYEEGTLNFLAGGDFVGSTESHISIASKKRTGGYFGVGCTVDPLAEEICAPSSLLVHMVSDAWTATPTLMRCADDASCPVPRVPLADTDSDGVFDLYDNCPSAANADQANSDFDAEGDACDSTQNAEDRDHDTVIDNADNCPDVSNRNQQDTDGDGLGDACDPNPTLADGDNDGVGNSTDNCPSVSNAGQADWDADGTGDACDDTDGDAVMDSIDNCRTTANADQADTDGDGVGNACDAPAYYLGKVANNGRCMQPNGSGDVYFVTCNAGDATQQWQLISVGSNFVLKNVGYGTCLRGYTDFWSVPYANVVTCNTGASNQQWQLRMDGSNSTNYPYQLKNASVNFCIWRNDSNRASGTLGNCPLIQLDRRSFGFYPEGNFSTVPFKP